MDLNSILNNVQTLIQELHLGNFLYIYLFLSFLVIFGILMALSPSNKTKSMTNEQVYEYIEQNIWRDSFFSKLYKILIPDIGDTVVLRHGRWSNLSGRITKCNSKNSYNIKLTKSLNPYHNDIPKKRIIRHRDEFYVDKS